MNNHRHVVFFNLILALLFRGSLAATLQQPMSVSSVDGELYTTIALTVGEISLEDGTRIAKAPLFNGTIPGPTLRIQQGDTLHITFRNDLPDDLENAHINNELSAPQESNLHLHGLFVSGELPSDDAKFVIRPGEVYNYEVQVPSFHMPGTHWYHPHRHGSTAFQLSCGAAGAVVVEDPPGFLPEDIASAPEVILLMEEMQWDETVELADESDANEELFLVDTIARNRVTLVNGQTQPTLSFETNSWMRFRIINAGWEGESMDLSIPGCEMQLLAKDGIYLRGVPRSVSAAHVFLGGRADVLVQCQSAGSYTMLNRGSNTVMNLQVTSTSPAGPTTIAPWTPPFPEYLEDLQSTSASDGCACTTKVGTRSNNNNRGRDDSINGKKFEDGVILHSTYLGAVVERELLADRHPYHQHTYPFQLIDILQQNRPSDPNYIQPGDWYDSWEGNAIVRYQPREFVTKVMAHCHILEHEDEGMMAMEIVKDASSASCTCDGFSSGGGGGGDRSGATASRYYSVSSWSPWVVLSGLMVSGSGLS